MFRSYGTFQCTDRSFVIATCWTFFWKYSVYRVCILYLSKVGQSMKMNFCRLRQGDEGFVFHKFRHGTSLSPRAQQSSQCNNSLVSLTNFSILLKGT